MKQVFGWTDILEVEDYLQTANIFSNGFTGRVNCSMDSYGTVVDYKELDRAIAESKFEKEKIEYCINYWKTNPNCQPPIKMVAFWWEGKFKKEKLDSDNHSVKVQP